MNAFKELVAPRKGDYVQRSDDTTLLTLHVLNFRNDLQITGHVQSSTFLTDDTEVQLSAACQSGSRALVFRV